ncbi:hypothetical protein T11_12856 [Trichinella zimbabwensis]|uniref:Uncharacterized protein n=1 Tax=Trichinella zimbabwensis TaxID=268475 RepID=A0A0V1HLB9_9BILA|nr:hypothetical protein T11_12856 [Trichinella zimbabwensis]
MVPVSQVIISGQQAYSSRRYPGELDGRQETGHLVDSLSRRSLLGHAGAPYFEQHRKRCAMHPRGLFETLYKLGIPLLPDGERSNRSMHDLVGRTSVKAVGTKKLYFTLPDEGNGLMPSLQTWNSRILHHG